MQPVTPLLHHPDNDRVTMNIWLEIKLISSQNHCQRFIDYGVAKNLALLFNWLGYLVQMFVTSRMTTAKPLFVSFGGQFLFPLANLSEPEQQRDTHKAQPSEQYRQRP